MERQVLISEELGSLGALSGLRFILLGEPLSSGRCSRSQTQMPAIGASGTLAYGRSQTPGKGAVLGQLWTHRKAGPGT